MKVLVCLLLALHVAVASEFCIKSFTDLDLTKYFGVWYNSARVKSRPDDVNYNCIKYDSRMEGEKFVFDKYEVDSTTNELVKKSGYANPDLEKGTTLMYFDNSDGTPVGITVLCLNPDFELSYFGDLADQQIYLYTKTKTVPEDISAKVSSVLAEYNIDATKLIPGQENCP